MAPTGILKVEDFDSYGSEVGDVPGGDRQVVGTGDSGDKCVA